MSLAPFQLRVFRDTGTGSAEPVRLAGERAAEAEAMQLREGIAVAEGLMNDLRRLTEELNLPDRLA
jgi:LDH2 family malate/lactate/ureidoglycolate dehydrogenase